MAPTLYTETNASVKSSTPLLIPDQSLYSFLVEEFYISSRISKKVVVVVVVIAAAGTNPPKLDGSNRRAISATHSTVGTDRVTPHEGIQVHLKRVQCLGRGHVVG